MTTGKRQKASAVQDERRSEPDLRPKRDFHLVGSPVVVDLVTSRVFVEPQKEDPEYDALVAEDLWPDDEPEIVGAHSAVMFAQQHQNLGNGDNLAQYRALRTERAESGVSAELLPTREM